MAKMAYIQTNFTAGEITPRMKGRTDVERYRNGAEIVENGIPVVHGGIDRRPGLRYLATAKYAGARKVRLIRYVFNAQQAYMLEFGHLYVRVYASNGAVVLDESLAPLEIVSPYTEDQLFGLTTKQGGDTMFVFHADVPTQRLRRLTATLWTFAAVPWIAEPFAELGVMPAKKLTLSAATVGTGRTGTAGVITVPNAPTIGTATALNAGARVAFTAPADNGGAPIDSYTATSNPGGITGTGTTSPIVMAGLTNGVAYTFTVTAHNTAGNSAASSASSAITPSAGDPSGALTATATPLDQSQSVVNGYQFGLLGPTASATTGTAPFTYAWAKLSGDVGLDVETNNAAQVTLSSDNYNATNYASLRCTITDALGDIGTVDVNIAVRHNRFGG